jgi:hypothetical protein
MSPAAIAKAADAFVASIEVATVIRVVDADALDERAWFSGHPDRLFCARADNGGARLIRRRPRQGADPDMYLRTFGRTSPPTGDSDGGLATAWYAAAHWDWPSERMHKAARRACKWPSSCTATAVCSESAKLDPSSSASRPRLARSRCIRPIDVILAPLEGQQS